jgi:tetratricopeptide (TPR) repeat protein
VSSIEPAVQLRHAFDRVRESGTSEIVVLAGETGRGKSFAVQSLYDDLARTDAYWCEGMAPTWPPISRRSVDTHRKVVSAIRRDDASDSVPSFFWFGVGAAPTEGYARVDMSLALASQADEQFGAIARDMAQRKDRRKAGLDLALTALGAFVPGAGPAMDAIDLLRGASNLFGSDSEEVDTLSATRSAIVAAQRATGRARPGVPTVLVLDDAQYAEHSTLYLSAGLLAQAETPGGASAAQPRAHEYFPPSLPEDPVSPVLAVVTVWSHRLEGDFQDHVRTWLDEARGAGIPITSIECTGVSAAEATELLTRWDDSFASRAIIDRLDGPDTALNPLVLALNVATLEESRHPLSGVLTADAAVLETLPTVPAQHLRDRVEHLRQDEGSGAAAAWILQTLAHLGPRPAEQLLESIVDEHPASRSALDLLRSHRLLSDPAPAVPGERRLLTRRLDPDVHRYLSTQPIPSAAADDLLRWSCQLLRWALDSLLPDDLRALSASSRVEVLDGLEPSARIVRRALAQGAAVHPDVATVAQAVEAGSRGERLDPASVPRASPAASGFAAFCVPTWRVDEEDLVEAVAHFRVSRATLRIVTPWLRTQLAHAPSPLERVLVEELSSLASDGHVALALAHHLRRRGELGAAVQTLVDADDMTADGAILASQIMRRDAPERATGVLAPWASRNQAAAIEYGSLLTSLGRRAEARQFLQSVKDRWGQAATGLARLHEQDGQLDAAIDVLLPMIWRDRAAALEAARLLTALDRRDEAITLLRSVVDRYPSASVTLAELLAADDQPDAAVDVLLPMIWRDQGAALEAARLLIALDRRDEAITLLHSVADRYANAAVMLADLLEEDGRLEAAVDVLRPMADRDQNSAIQAARLLSALDRRDESTLLLRSLADRYANVAVALAERLEESGDLDGAVETL